MKARAHNQTLSSAPSICSRVHFRPLIRAHTDVTLGHCSYLNTCYSEPTYAQSPSIPPFPSANASRQQNNVTLPSGLGAGGRGKEKAPCRYLHFEVDWDEGDGETPSRNTKSRRRAHKLGIGLGPSGKEVALVGNAGFYSVSFRSSCLSSRRSGCTATSASSITRYWASFTSSWLIHRGISI